MSTSTNESAPAGDAWTSPRTPWATMTSREWDEPAAEFKGGYSAPDLGSYAIAYARVGLPVIPLVPGGKTPHRLAPHGKDSASSDVEQVRDWWVQAPEANIGIRPAEGIVVVDVDPRDGGASNLAALVAEYGHLSPTWTAHTGGGGLHAWFRCPGPYRGKLCPGVDLKSTTGYVVAPPSMHASGQRYQWANDLPIAAAPLWFAERLVAPMAPLRGAQAGIVSGDGGDGLIKFVTDSVVGERNGRVFWAACRAAQGGTLPAVATRLHEAAVAVGLSFTEAAATIASAGSRYGVRA